jgi:hypothetical protein
LKIKSNLQDNLEEFCSNQKHLFIERCDELKEKGSGWVASKSKLC